MTVDNFKIQDVFYDHYTNLTDEAILKMNKNGTSGELNNVVVGLNKHCYGLWLIDDEKEIKYQLFYVRGDKNLEGALIKLTADLTYRDELVFYFAYFLSHNYNDLDLIDTFNTFQGQTRGLLEKLGFLTVSSTELDKIDDPNAMIIAKGVKGIIPIRLITKGNFYRDFFGNKILPIEEGEYVYLMLNTRNDCVKIGKSKRPTFREKTLQADEPDIELITYWIAPSTIEKQLHKKFETKRKRGEWFDLNFKDLKEIKDFMDNYENKGSS
jgi:hypothetical protein